MNVRAILLALYSEQKKIPFAWGSADCLTFCGDCVRALNGSDPIAAIRGRYKTETGAKRLMTENGCKTLNDVALKEFEPIPVASANDGDWAWLEHGAQGETLGVVVGSRIMARAPEGIGLVPLTQAKAAYRVPR